MNAEMGLYLQLGYYALAVIGSIYLGVYLGKKEIKKENEK